MDNVKLGKRCHKTPDQEGDGKQALITRSSPLTPFPACSGVGGAMPVKKQPQESPVNPCVPVGRVQLTGTVGREETTLAQPPAPEAELMAPAR